jgi:hypothetical protein
VKLVKSEPQVCLDTISKLPVKQVMSPTQ